MVMRTEIPSPPGAGAAYVQAVTGAQGVEPGPCSPIYGCPDPTEIVCIEVPKVYDFCFQTDSLGTICTPIPAGCVGATRATCTITDVTCAEVARMQLLGGFANVTLAVAITRTITLTDNTGTPVCPPFTTTDNLVKTVALCAPVGTTVDCFAGSTSCGPCFISNGNVCCQVAVCLLIESTAVVKLLVPAYGFCVPSECEELPPPELQCPPENLFPPQCAPA